MNEDIMETLRKEYINSLKETIKTMRSLLAEQNFNELQKIFHKLKGSGATYGFQEITDRAGEIESKLKNGEINAEEIEGFINFLESLVAREGV